MRKTSYLFGEGFDPLIIDAQKSVAIYKIQRTKDLLTKLVAVEVQEQDTERINAIVKARDFWISILEEEL